MAKQKIGILAATLVLAALAMPAFGQAADPNPRPRADPAQFRQRMLDRLKQDLGTTDEEFTALQPKIEKVFTAQREAMGGRFGGRRGGPGGGSGTPGAPAPGATDQPQSPVQEKVKDLEATLENKDAKPDQIKARLDALREAKTKAKADLTAAQQDLRGVLTQRQEAVLVMAGLLD